VFKLGNEVIKETKSYKHLGPETDKTLNTKKPILDAGNKHRGSLLSIHNSIHNNGINPQLLNPITSRTNNCSVVIPRALYGCELWNSY
jgi:hypothetical protein